MPEILPSCYVKEKKALNEHYNNYWILAENNITRKHIKHFGKLNFLS